MDRLGFCCENAEDGSTRAVAAAAAAVTTTDFVFIFWFGLTNITMGILRQGSACVEDIVSVVMENKKTEFLQFFEDRL